MDTTKLDEAIELMQKHWGHGEAPYNEEMLKVLSLLEEFKENFDKKRFGDVEKL